MSDVFSRPSVCYIILISYVVGFVMLLKSPNLATYIVGQVFVSIGGAGLGLLSSVITADLVSLKWRGFAQGVLSTPYIVIPCKSFPTSLPFPFALLTISCPSLPTGYSAYISANLVEQGQWRWGYGAFSACSPSFPSSRPSLRRF